MERPESTVCGITAGSVTAMRYSDSEKAYLAAAAALPDVGPVSLRRVLALLRTGGMDIGDLCTISAGELQREAGIGARPAAALAGLNSPLESGVRLQEQLFSRGVRVIFEDDELYPHLFREKLGRESPLLLFVAGCVELLCGDCIGIVGSRRPSPGAAEAAEAFSARLARRGRVIVSGAAAGIDSCAHAGALSAGGTVFLPPQGLLKFRWRREWVIQDDESWCLASQFPPTAGWEAKYALIRNKMITALARAVVAFEPRDRGGTWHSSNMALKMGKPLYVVPSGESRPHVRGHDRLLRRGAKSLDISAMPLVEEFETMVADCDPPVRERRAPLFGDEPDGERL